MGASIGAGFMRALCPVAWIALCALVAACGAGGLANNVAAAVPALTIDTVSLAGATQGSTYSQTVRASGGLAAYQWRVAGGALPDGLVLATMTSGEGSIGGQALSTAATSDVVIEVRDSLGATAQRQFRIEVAPLSQGAPLAFAGSASFDVVEGQPFAIVLSAAGGTPPYIWNLTNNPLWVAIDPVSGQLNAVNGGAPSGSAGTTVTFDVEVGDSGSVAPVMPVTQQVQLSILPPSLGGPNLLFTTSTLPDAIVGQAYATAFQATGGMQPYTFEFVGLMPTGLLFDTANGDFYGSPAQAAPYTFSIKVTDATNATALKQFTLNVLPPPAGIAIDATGLGLAFVGAPYSGQLVANGGTEPYIWVATAQLPALLSLDSTGMISGTPEASAAGLQAIGVRVTDANGVELSASISLAVLDHAALNPVIPAAYEGLPYSFQATVLLPGVPVTAATPAIPALGAIWLDSRWDFDPAASTVPAGMHVNESNLGTIGQIWPCEIYGIPAYGQAGSTFSIVFKVSKTKGSLDNLIVALNLTVSSAPFQIASHRPLVTGYAGQPYGERIIAGGGSGAGAVWSVVAGSGSLPQGLVLDNDGHIYGALDVSTAGTHSFTVKASENGTGANATLPVSMTILSAPAPGTTIPITEGIPYYPHSLTAMEEEGVAALATGTGDIYSMAFDPQGDLYFCETRWSSRIRKIDRTTRLITTVAGTRTYSGLSVGPVNATMMHPCGISFAPDGACYFGGIFSATLRRITAAGTPQSLWSYNYSGPIAVTTSIAISPAGTHVYMCDVAGHVVWEYEIATGASRIAAGTGIGGTGGDGGRAIDATLFYPQGLGFDAQGNLYVAMIPSMIAMDGRIRKIAIDPASGYLTDASVITLIPATIDTHPWSDIVVDGSGAIYYLSASGANFGRGTLVSCTETSASVTAIAECFHGGDKRGLAMDPVNGDLYISGDPRAGRISKVIR